VGRGQKVPYFIDKKLITKEYILELAESHLNGGHVYVTGIKIGSDNRINVFIDGDEGVTIKDCVALSRAIEGRLDRGKEDFALDVSSHGATTPLVMPRQYKKHLGREFQILLLTGEKAEGTMVSYNNEGITLEYSTRENKPVGKGKITVVRQRSIRYDEMKESKIKLKY
jgi:ribosome maturation factor RimP